MEKKNGKEGGNLGKIPEKFAKWKGVPRDEIDWHPIIDENKCVGCGFCFTTCGRDVFDYDKNRKKAIVARPLQCMVGCTSCEVWCIFGAISFPDKKVVRDFIKEKKLLATVRNELEKKLSELNKNFGLNR
ncbi:MAG: ferredoxin family protein [Candidatus Ratteibacteria bacterium]